MTARDNYYTPTEALNPIVPILSKCMPKEDYVIWEPCAGKGHIVKFLEKKGYGIIGTDIEDGHDFFNFTPDFWFDAIVTNPPFSLRNEFLQKCYSINKPFLLLLPENTIGSQTRYDMFEKYGFTLFMLRPRISYTGKYAVSNSSFHSHWFGHDLDGFENNKIYYI